jgi:tagaturonate reductase
MKQLNRALIETQNFPTKIMQFGEGNFLRAFVDWQINQLNKQTDLNAGIAIIRPIDYDQLPLLNTQDGLYTCIVRGINEQGEATEEITVIESVNEEVAIYKDFSAYLNLAENPDIQFIFSNTTEAGIEFLATDKLDDKPAAAFPAKLTQWLLHRYTHFNGDDNKGVIIIP